MIFRQPTRLRICPYLPRWVVPILRTFVLLVLLSKGTIAQSPLETNPASFLQQYKQDLLYIRSTLENIQIEGSITREYAERTDETRLEEQEISYSARGDEASWTFRTKSGNRSRDDRKAAFLLQSGRAFTLKQLSSGGNYAIVQRSNNPRDYDKLIEEDLDTFVRASITVGQLGLLRSISNGRLHIKSLSNINENAEDLLRVDFLVTAADKPAEPVDAWAMEGWMTLDPARHLAVREHDVQMTQKNAYFNHRSTGKVTYSREDRDDPLPRDVQITLTAPFSKVMHFRASSASPTAPPASAFKLAAFGLGDFDHPPRRDSISGTWWALGASILALGGGLALRVRARHA